MSPSNPASRRRPRAEAMAACKACCKVPTCALVQAKLTDRGCREARFFDL